MKTLTVAALIQALQAMPQSDEVRVWLPGSTIALGSVFKYKGAVRIEGTVDEGSALDTAQALLLGRGVDRPDPATEAYLDRFPPDQRATAERAWNDGYQDAMNDKESDDGTAD